MTAIERLLNDGLLERVPIDTTTAQAWIEDAARHLEAALHIADLDLAGSYTLAYDAARKAMSAHMLSRGLRTRSVLGAHRAIAIYAESLGNAEPALLRLDRMRRNRNRSEYGVRVFGRQEVDDGIEVAERIVAFGRRSFAT